MQTTLQIFLNITFILMITCSNKSNNTDNKLFGSTHFLKPKNITNLEHKMNITVTEGNFTITNNKVNIKNNTIGREVKNELNDMNKAPTIASIFNPLLQGLQNFFMKPSHVSTLPDFNGKQANFTGNGTYKYTNSTTGHSLEVHITQNIVPQKSTGPFSEKNREKMYKLNEQHSKKVAKKELKDVKSDVDNFNVKIKNSTQAKDHTHSPSFLEVQSHLKHIIY